MKRSAVPFPRAAPYLWALLACGVVAMLALPLLSVIDPTNIAMLLLLPVVGVAALFGSLPAALAAIVSVALFDWLFVPPRLSWAVADAQYLITFMVMLVVALVIGQLAARLRERAREAMRREARTQALYGMARELSGALTVEQVVETVRRFLAEQANATARLHLPPIPPASFDVMRVYESGEILARLDADIPTLLLPLRSPLQTRGVLQVSADPSALSGESRQLLDAVATLAAIVVERIHFVEVAQEANLQMASERLRAALLSAVSHDLRTPLTVLVGLADTLAQAAPAAGAETAAALRDQALRLSNLVGNLLEMARLQVGQARLRKEWQPLEEVVGASLKAMEVPLAGRDVRIDLASDLPLIAFDAVLIERVLCNLLENAAKYAPRGEIAIEARRRGDLAEIAVLDRGPGVPEGGEEAIFALFERGTQEGAALGVGLGLAICRAIVEAHGGTIRAENRHDGGTCVRFTLPLGRPPRIEEEPDGGG